MRRKVNESGPGLVSGRPVNPMHGLVSRVPMVQQELPGAVLDVQVQSPTSVTSRRLLVTAQPIESSARLMQIDSDDPVWRSSPVTFSFDTRVIKGAFFKLLPPEGTTLDQIEAVRQALNAQEAMAIRVQMPRTEKQLPDHRRDVSAVMVLRDVCRQLVERSTVEDREALLALVETIADEMNL